MSILDELKAEVIDIDVEVENVVELAKKALNQGLCVDDVLNQALIPAMDIVGDKYERGELFIPEMLLAANAMKGVMELLRPLLTQTGAKMEGRVVIGAVEGDLHDIGVNLVSMMLEGVGFKVYNLGTEVTAEEFIKAVRERDANLLGMSALLTTTMLKIKEVIEVLDNSGIRDKVKVMIGGAPLTRDYANEIGADGYAPDAPSAVKLAKRLSAELKIVGNGGAV